MKGTGRRPFKSPWAYLETVEEGDRPANQWAVQHDFPIDEIVPVAFHPEGTHLTLDVKAYRNKKMREALNVFQHATSVLVNVFQEQDLGTFTEDYPFEQSFDEVADEIISWVETSLKSIPD